MSDLEPVLLDSGPTEVELLTLMVLSRIYDIQLALLNHFAPDRADEIYEAHQRGETFQPTMYVPDLTRGVVHTDSEESE